MSLIQDVDLAEVLLDAEVDDLRILIDHITDKGAGRISLPASTCTLLVQARANSSVSTSTRAVIAEELSRFGGNSLMNLFRGGGGVSYREIACDVADHLKAEHRSDSNVAAMEHAILEKLAEQMLAKMNEEQKVEFFKQLGMPYVAGSTVGVATDLLASVTGSHKAAYQLSAVIANGVVTTVLGRGLISGAGAFAGGATLVAPVALALSVVWGLYGLTSPAYRVTVPCVIHVAYMRRKRAIARACWRCGKPGTSTELFCSGCGAPLMRNPVLSSGAAQ